MSRPVIEFSDARQVITIDGVEYSYDFFHMLGAFGMKPGNIVQVDSRKEGAVVLTRRYDLEKKEGGAMLAEIESTMIPSLGQKETEELLAHCDVLTSGQDVPPNWCRTEAVHEAYIAMQWGERVLVRHGIVYFVGPHQHCRSVFYFSKAAKIRLQAEVEDATKALYKIVYGKEYKRDDVCPICGTRPACDHDCR